MLNKIETQPPVSVVILNYNRKKFAIHCLKSVLRANYPPFEIIFVDNASTDGSVATVRELFGSMSYLKIISNSENLGCAGGFNVGARVAKGKYIAFLASDTEVDRDWLREAVKVMEQDETIGAIQPKYLLPDHKTIDTAGAFVDPFGFLHNRGHMEEDMGQYDKVNNVFWSCSAAMVIRRSVLQEVGLFDPTTFFTGEDVDLCWRIWLRGYRVVFAPASRVYHMCPYTRTPISSEMGYFHSCKNHTTLLLKNYALRNLLKYLPPNVFLICISSAYFAFNGEVNKALAGIKSIIWVVSNFRCIWGKRMCVERYIRKVSDKEIAKRVFCNPNLLQRVNEVMSHT